jgi:hypothetical protein
MVNNTPARKEKKNACEKGKNKKSVRRGKNQRDLPAREWDRSGCFFFLLHDEGGRPQGTRSYGWERKATSKQSGQWAVDCACERTERRKRPGN